MTGTDWLFLVPGWGLIPGLTLFAFTRILSGNRTLGGAGDGRGHRASRMGLILAMAGNAIGPGNFLRYPVQAAKVGGVFMIPCFCVLLFPGIPPMWVEWTIGRPGGVHGHGSTPGLLELLWENRAAKYPGAPGIALPFANVEYYTFVESRCKAYAFFPATGAYFGNTSREITGQFPRGFR